MRITNRSVSLAIEGRVKRVTLTLLLVIGAGGPAGAQIGEIFDPAGDAINPGGTSDLASARIAVQGSNLRLEVRYAPGTFNADGTHHYDPAQRLQLSRHGVEVEPGR